MAVEHAGVRTLLLADATVGGLLKSGSRERLYPVHAGQNPVVPFGVITRIGGLRRQRFDGPSAVSTITLQIDLFETTSAKLRVLADAVRVVLNGYVGTTGGVEIKLAELESERDVWEESVELHRCIQIYSVTFTEALS